MTTNLYAQKDILAVVLEIKRPRSIYSTWDFNKIKTLFNECDSLWPSKVSDIFNTTRCNDTRSFITLKFLLIYVSIKTKTKISKVPYLCNAIRIEWLDLTCHYMLILKHNIIILAAQTKLNWSTLLPICTIITSPRNPQIPKNLCIYIMKALL